MEIPARSFSDVLNEGIRLLGRVWRRLIPPSFGAFVVLGAATLAVFRWSGANQFLDLVFGDPASLQAMTDAELYAVAEDFLLAVTIALVLQAIAAGFVSLAAYRLLGSELAGESTSAAAASRFAASRMVTFLVASVAALFAVALGLILLVVPGVWLAGRLSMLVPVIAFEGPGPAEALQRSSALVKGRWWPTVGFLLLVGLLGSVASQLTQLVALPLLAIGSLGIGAGLSFAVAIVIQGFIIAAIALMSGVWYLDLRTRQETLFTENLG